MSDSDSASASFSMSSDLYDIPYGSSDLGLSPLKLVPAPSPATLTPPKKSAPRVCPGAPKKKTPPFTGLQRAEGEIWLSRQPDSRLPRQNGTLSLPARELFPPKKRKRSPESKVVSVEEKRHKTTQTEDNTIVITETTTTTTTTTTITKID